MTNQNRRTLADMTPEEINQCRGMWCDCDDDEGNIYLYVFNGMRGKDAIFTTPGIVQGGGGPGWTLPDFGKLITPRFDLPRAWNADGTPPNGFWEYDTIEIQSYPEPRGITDRRWVSDWEAIE